MRMITPHQFSLLAARRPSHSATRSARGRTAALIITSLLALGLVGCSGSSSTPGIQLPSDPRAATTESLESLFGQISLQLQSAKPGSNQALELQSQLGTVGGELGQRSAASARKRVSEIARIDGRLPLADIDREIAAIESIRGWDLTAYNQISTEFAKERDATRRAIAEGEDRLKALAPTDLVPRINLIQQLSDLAGAGSPEQARYAREREEILGKVSREAEEAIRSENYEKAQGLLGIVNEVNPEDETARKQKCDVDGKVIVRRFNAALETGRFGTTMDMLDKFAETDCFGEIRSGLAREAGPVAEAFGILGQESTSAGDLAGAYERYKDASTLSELLLDRKADLPGIDAFVKKLDKKYDGAFKAGEYGVAWGILNVMTEFSPPTPAIIQKLRMTRDEIQRRAVRGITAYPFEDPKASPTKVGDAVSSKVVQHIFHTIPGDVRIVEREQLERILEECKRRGTCNDLDTADFIVQGTILDAKVETTEKNGRETRRVVTGNEAVTNPDHVRWAQLPEKERKKTAEPARTVSRDVTEDVTIKITSVRKVGIISVSYRVVEASSGRVLFTDSIQTKQEFQDEGREGVQLGNFKQETDFVELPPDIEILSGTGGLADKISEEIGVKLVDFLKDPEEQYSKDAARFVSEGDFAGAARMAAYSIVLRDIKAKEIGTLRRELNDYAMQSPSL